ncbi:hypothetical protein QBZ16_000933 [Prototheca wickerhamii]|uniref:NADH dehydrogenase [ubiquinone] iron-sulfur protein 5 n=1 Tax=Prototheca wickerhamii TaxID=3111 RepID=A0AAD9IF68_PROWI|nr:hypothetical protein QBZ16_000933 [Prototheca wickerhamii]
MASGFGLRGGPNRCYAVYMDFSECMSKTDDPRKCNDYREDYLECLHHRKEVRGFLKLNTLFREVARQTDGEAPAAGHGGGH